MNQMMPLVSQKIGLDNSYIGSSRTFRPLLDVKGHAVTFIEGFKTGRIYSAVMHEYIRSIVLFDEAETFSVIKPLYSSVYHNTIFLSKISTSPTEG